jgi:3-hexulose-6-phosphate synthase
LDGVADIIEIGTTVIKEFGMKELSELRLSKSQLLFDTKTNEEGDFEFEKAFDAGADIATVMGAIDETQLDLVYGITQSENREMLIDLLNLDDGQISKLTKFDKAIFGLHNLPGVDAVQAVSSLSTSFPQINRIAVAGGVTMNSAIKLREQNIAEIVIVGGAILKAENITKAAKEFKEVLA